MAVESSETPVNGIRGASDNRPASKQNSLPTRPSLALRLEQWLSWLEEHPRLSLGTLVFLLTAQISPWFYPTGDGSLYLSTVREFLSQFRAGQVSEFRCFVPPGYPLLILPAFLTGDKPFLALSILNWALAMALLLGTYRWMKRQFPSAAVLLTGVVMVNITLWTFYRRPLKELAFMAMLMWSVELLHHLLRPKPTRTTLLYAGGTGLLITLLSLIRYPGLTLVIGFTLAVLVQARRGDMSWKRAVGVAAAVGILPVIAIGSWLAYDKQYAGGAVYLQEITGIYTEDYDNATEPPPDENPSLQTWTRHLYFSDSKFVRSTLPQFLAGLQYRVTDLGCMSLPGFWKAVPDPSRWLDPWRFVYFAFFLLLLAGWWRIVRRRVDVLILTTPAYFLLYVHWVCDQPGGRFMLPILPAIVACTWMGCGLKQHSRACLFGLVLLLHLGQSTAYWLLIDAPRAINMDRQWHIADRFAESIRVEPSFVGIQDLPLEVFLALNLTLDSRTRPQALAEPITPDIRWIVTPAGMAAPPDFILHDSVEGYTLLHRSSVQQGSTTVNVKREDLPPRLVSKSNEEPLSVR